MNRSNPASSLRLITEEASSRETHLTEIAKYGMTIESDDYANSKPPIMDQFYKGDGPKRYTK